MQRARGEILTPLPQTSPELLQRATDTDWMNVYRRNPDRDSISTPTAALWR